MNVEPLIPATIVHVITLLELGGAQEITLFTCRNLDRRRFRVHLVAGCGGLLDDEARGQPDLETHFCPDLLREVHPIRDARGLASLTRLFRRIRSESAGPMLVHTHSSKAGILGRWAARAAGVSTIVHSIHGFGFHPEQPWAARAIFQGLEWATAPLTAAFCPVSAANRDVAKGLGLFRHDPEVLLTPSGIDPVDYEPEPGERETLRAELGIPQDAPLVGMIACLKPQKAPLDFVRVAAQLMARHPACHFLVAGDGELRAAVEHEAEAAGLGSKLHLLGWRRDVRRILASIDILVLTSIFEGLPRVLLQAMAAKRPVVASAVDGVPEAVIEGVTGFLVPPHDLDRFVERIDTLVRDPERARSMGDAAHRELRRYDVRRMLHELEGLYERLLARAPT